jgi:agmatinase
MQFDPNAPAKGDAGVFGLPSTLEDAALVLLPVPWEATTSYGGGTAEGPRAILNASKQVDLYDLDVQDPYQAGIHMLPESAEVRAWNAHAKALAQEVIQNLDTLPEQRKSKLLGDVNAISRDVTAWVKRETETLLKAGKIVGLVGGDHSVPLGAFQAAGEHFGEFGILHFDAHSDTRNAYEGFQESHASIMHNALNHVPQLETLVQVGIRDMCTQEMEFVQQRRIHLISDREIQTRKFRGVGWDAIARGIVQKLPQRVWVSFDIDGLDPRFCPNTGTPVPGGLDFAEAVHLIAEIVRAGKTIIGFDLCEVAPSPDQSDEWDGNVGARLLFKLCGLTFASQKRTALFPLPA